MVAAISEGCKGELFEVLLQELDGFVVRLRSGSGLFFGARDSPLLALSAYRLSEERLTEKARAARALDMPPSTEETILCLKSSE